MMRVPVLFCALLAGAWAETTTPVYFKVAEPTKNNAGQTLETYINLNVKTCLTDAINTIKDGAGAAWDPTKVGAAWSGVPTPLMQDCTTTGDNTMIQQATDAKVCANWDETAKKACAYTDKKVWGCTTIADACYKAWQEAGGETTTTAASTTSGATTASTTAAGATTTAAATTAAATTAAAAATTAAAGATTAASGTAAGGSQPIVIKFVPAPAGSTGTGSTGSQAQPSAGQSAPMDKGTIPTGCDDGHPLCSFWSGKGECDKNPDYMKLYCKKACQSCNGASGSGTGSTGGTAGGTAASDPNCKDDNPSCAQWSSSGECDKNPYYMKDKCCKSCNGAGWSGMQTGGGACANSHKLCEFWGKEGECTKNPDYMNAQCKKACNKC